ncbi:MAG: TRAP transporter small permease [Alphaproteobacteria bacterium]|nr:TRAP transporter small permease [Alphaproteobacteria bacterium]
MIRHLDRLEAAIAWLARAWLVVMLAVVVAFTFGQALDRYAVHSQFNAHDQIAKLALVWLGFVGFAVAIRDDATIRVDIIDARLPPRLRAVRDALFDLAMLGLMALIQVKAWPVIEVGGNLRILGTPFTAAVTYAALAAGSALAIVFLALRLLRRLRGVATATES